MKLLDSAVLNASSHMVIIPEKPSCNPGETMANKEVSSPVSCSITTFAHYRTRIYHQGVEEAHDSVMTLLQLVSRLR